MYPYFLLRERECRGCFGSLGGGEEECMRGWLRYLCRRKMRYQTFLHHVEALREAGFALSLDPSGAIRFFAPTGEEHCPITAVCAMTTGKTYDLRQYQEAGRDLGMGSHTIQTIADSADSTCKTCEYYSARHHRTNTRSGIVKLLIILPHAWPNHPGDDPSRIARTTG